MRGDMQSLSGFLGSVVLVAGVVAAATVAIGFKGNPEPLLHLVLAATFFLVAAAAMDFLAPRWLALSGAAAMAAFAGIFLLQGVADLTQSAALDRLAFQQLGQIPERLFGYVFLAGCLFVLVRSRPGPVRTIGLAVAALIVAAEAYALVVTASGGTSSGLVKLLYVPLFVWLLLESRRPRTTPAATP